MGSEQIDKTHIEIRPRHTLKLLKQNILQVPEKCTSNVALSLRFNLACFLCDTRGDFLLASFSLIRGKGK